MANSSVGVIGNVGKTINSDVVGDSVSLTAGTIATVNDAGGYLSVSSSRAPVTVTGELMDASTGSGFDITGENRSITQKVTVTRVHLV